MIAPPLKPTMMTTTIIDFLRELGEWACFQAPYFVCRISRGLYAFPGGMSRPGLAWFQCLSPYRMKFGSGPRPLQTEGVSQWQCPTV
jgi:hypothetical protein